MILLRDAVAAVHVAREPRHVKRLAAIVALHQRDRGRCRLASLQHAAKPQCAGQAKRNFGLHVGELLLNELIGGERAVELLAVEHVLARAMPAELGRPHGAPGDAVARIVEAAEGAGQPLHVRK